MRLQSNWSKEDCGDPFVVFADADGSREVRAVKGEDHPKNSRGEPADKISVWLRPLLSGDEEAIENAAFEMDTRKKKSKARLKTGTGNRMRICRCVVAIEGIDGETTIHERNYGDIPAWLTKRIKERIDKMNERDEDTEGES